MDALLPARHAVVTCGPALAPIDDVRRITNFSTGELGVRLCEELVRNGWRVTCLKGTGATYRDPEGANLRVIPFETNGDLLDALVGMDEPESVSTVFHAAALCDFEVFRIEGPDGTELLEKKIPSFYPEVRVLLRPSFKLLPRLEEIFPKAKVVGWKFELRGDRASALTCAKVQLDLVHSSLCVLNGAAYGDGFGIMDHSGLIAEVASRTELSRWLCDWAERSRRPLPKLSAG
ncbi:MAG: Coenzyme biosynthesis bifunctional protein CoaBC [Verrucomicrobiota bacterium]|jgi:phosphopantothenoylcysteine synthetase/decarboxylase